jgi:exosortase
MADLEVAMTSSTQAESGRRDVARSWQLPLLAGLALAVMLAWIFRDFLGTNVRKAIQQQADWGHTLVIPFIAAYFVYLKRDKLLAQPFRTAWFGLIPVILGIGWYVFCTMTPAFRHHNLQGAGVGLTLAGLALLFFGWRSMIWLWFPLAYLMLFGQFISDRFLNIVTFKMQDITARGSHIVLSMFMESDRSGNTLYIFDNGVSKPLNIAEACSGMRMLMAFLALGIAMGFTGLKHTWQQVVLVILAVPTAIFVNILRVVTLAVLALVNPNFAAGDFHSFIGLVWLLPAFLIYLGLMWILRHMVVEVDTRHV